MQSGSTVRHVQTTAGTHVSFTPPRSESTQMLARPHHAEHFAWLDSVVCKHHSARTAGAGPLT